MDFNLHASKMKATDNSTRENSRAQLEMPNARLIMHRDAVLTILGRIETWRGSTEEPPCLYPGVNLKPNATSEQQH
jgi:hypothetical protein